MAVSPFILFARKNVKPASLKGLSVPARGKALGKLYKALPAADKAALIKAAKATPAFKRTKVVRSVQKQAVALGIPLKFVRASWYKTAGSSTPAKLRNIAKANNIKIRVAKKAVAVVKKAAPAKKVVATKKVAKK